MSFEIPKPVKTLLAEGAYIGILVSIIDIGTQELTFEGRTSWKRRLRFSFEIPGERRQWTDDENVEHDVPHFVSKVVTQSLHKRATLTRILKTWGKLDSVLEQNTIDHLLGEAAMLTISHGEYEGEPYAGLEAVSPVMAGVDVPDSETPQSVFHLGAPNRDIYEAMPDWLRETIQKAEEWPSASALLTPEPKTEEQLDEDIGF